MFLVLFVTVFPAFCVSWKSADTPQPQADELVILVTGGVPSDFSAEVLYSNGSRLCSLPPMPQSEWSHIQSGLTVCGGLGSSSATTTCSKFQSGSWITLTENLLTPRYYHSSWTTPEGDILLLGGDVGEKTTEIVYQNGTSVRSFDLKYSARSSCTIELPESFLVTGGYEIPVFIGITRKVSRYSTSGWIENLPNLNEGRDSHGCGFFYNDAMERVFLVAGGYFAYNYRSSTEILVEGGLDWSFQEPLPSERNSLRGISLPDTVLMTGGWREYPEPFTYDDVFMFDSKNSSWIRVGEMEVARRYHGLSLVDKNDVIKYCN